MTKNKPTNPVIFAGWQKALAELTRKRQRLQFELGGRIASAQAEEHAMRQACRAGTLAYRRALLHAGYRWTEKPVAKAPPFFCGASLQKGSRASHEFFHARAGT